MLAKKILSKYNLDLKALVPPYNFGHFPHLFKGYAGLCYGYLWAEVFAADLFEHISQTHGALSKEAGTLIRRFLAIGNNVPFTTFYEQQLGRMPDVSALLRLRTAVS